MEQKKDQITIDKVLRGDVNAFSTIVDQHKAMVFTLSLRMLKDRSEAEEIAQDTFVKVYEKLAKFKSKSKLSTWIYKVCYNTCLDRLKRRKRQYNLISIDEFAEKKLSESNNAQDDMEADEFKMSIKACVEELSAEASFLITLYYYEDKSMNEIGEILGVSPNNAKVKLFRARKKLSEMLRKRLDTEMRALHI